LTVTRLNNSTVSTPLLAGLLSAFHSQLYNKFYFRIMTSANTNWIRPECSNM